MMKVRRWQKITRSNPRGTTDGQRDEIWDLLGEFIRYADSNEDAVRFHILRNALTDDWSLLKPANERGDEE